MSGLPDSLINPLRDTLSRCDVFESDGTLRPLFADSRLSTWRDRLPQANSTRQRAEKVIDFLHDKYGDEGNVLLALLDVLQNYLGPDDSLSSELAKLAQELAAYMPTKASASAESPYKGLLYYDVNDAPLFFGRERVTNELLEHLRQYRFLAVVGASGSGKSSVVRAGVIPALQQGAVEINGRSSRDWPIHIITPGDEPLKALAATLTRDSESVTAAAILLEDLQTSSQSLDLFLFRQAAGSRLLLVMDQFEELFTQCDDPEARHLLVENLVTAINSGRQGRLSLILTLRADFYAQAVPFEGLRPLLETQQKIVGAMTLAELREAIEEPARQAGWHFQPGLVDRLLADVGGEPGALPLLSHALLETWRRREGRTLTHAGYVASGQVAGAIAATAQRTFDGLTPTQQSIARHIFLQLTELGEGTEDTRRRVERKYLTSRLERMGLVDEVLTILADARLVTTDENSAEVAHEALIRNWPELRRWLDENREGLRLHRKLAVAAQEWYDNNREEGYLYRGGQLAQIQEWLSQESPDLHPVETAFVTASKESQESAAAERAFQIAALQKANAQLERLDQTKLDFINVISHELRTPLTLVRGYSHLLLTDKNLPENDFWVESVHGIQEGAIHMGEIVNSMLEVLKIDTQALELHAEPVSIAPMLQMVLVQFEESLAERDLTLTVEDLSDIPAIEGDIEALQKVFHHLISNAIKYTPNRGKITIYGRMLVDSDIDLPREGIEIVVQDTGIGIDPHSHDLIFVKFYQTGKVALHSSGKTAFKAGGPGLGLAIARGIVEAHGGKLWVESPGYDEVTLPGSVFHVALPLRQR